MKCQILKKYKYFIILILLSNSFGYLFLDIFRYFDYNYHPNFPSNLKAISITKDMFMIITSCYIYNYNIYAFCLSVYKETDNTKVISDNYFQHNCSQYPYFTADLLRSNKIIIVYHDQCYNRIFYYHIDMYLNKLNFGQLLNYSNGLRQTRPFVKTLNKDKFILTWSEGNYYIYANIFNNDLSIIKERILISYNNGYYADYSNICQMIDSNIIISFQEYDNTISKNSIFFKIYSEEGIQITEKIKANENSKLYDERYPNLECLNNNSFLISWKRTNDNCLYGAIFDEQGKIIKFQKLTDQTEYYDQNMRNTALKNGGFLVSFSSWSSYASGYLIDDYYYGTYFKKFKKNFSQEGGYYLINTEKYHSQVNPFISKSISGNYIASWISYNSNFYSYWVYVYDFLALDDLVSSSNLHGQQKNSSVNTLSDEKSFAIAWRGFSISTKYYEIWVKIYDFDTNSEITEAIQVNFSNNNYCHDYPKILALSSGKFITIFIRNNSNCDGAGQIWAVLFNNDGTILKNETLLINCNIDSISASKIQNIKLYELPNNKFIIFWDQFNIMKNSISGIYCQVFTTNDLTDAFDPNITNFNSILQGNKFAGDFGINKKSETDFTYILTWTSITNLSTTNINGIYGCILNSSGNNISLQFDNEKIREFSIVGVFPNNNFIFSYRIQNISSYDYDIGVQLFNYEGGKLGLEKILNPFQIGNQIIYGLIISSEYIYAIYQGNTQKDTNGIGLLKLDHNFNLIYDNTVNRMKFGEQSFPAFAMTNDYKMVITYNSTQGVRDLTTLYHLIENCGDDLFSDKEDSNFCKGCAFTCLGGCKENRDNCNNCKSGYFKKSGSNLCISNNTIGKYIDSSLNIYKNCDPSCLECINSATNCLKCATNYYPLFNNLSSCKNSAPDNYYFNSNSLIYEQCSTNCKNCVNTKENCISCNPNYYLLEDKNTCYDTPPQGYYYIQSESKYKKCDVSCAQCSSSAKICSICNNGYYPLSNNINDCRNELNVSINYFFNNNQYFLCDSSCTKCELNSNNCLECSDNYAPLEDHNNTCIQISLKTYYSISYSKGYFFNNQIDKFSLCDISCKDCIDNPSFCSRCNTSQGYYPLFDNLNKCLNSSPEGYFFSSTNKKYEKCDISCKTCETSSNNCNECNKISKYYFVQNQPNVCKNTTPFGYYFKLDSEMYMNCDISCQTCENSASYCSNCNTSQGYFPLFDNINKCLNSTPEGYFFSSTNKKYEKCDISCKTCETSSNNCILCNTINNYYPLENERNTCKNSAPSGYYFNIDLNIFKFCDTSCLTCEGSPTNCITCSLNYYYLEDKPNTCKKNPVNGYYLNNTKKIYMFCDKSCNTCFDTEKKCSLCSDNYYPLSTDINDCRNNDNFPQGYFLTNSSTDNTTKYFPCDKSCFSCINKNNSCTVCSENYYPLEDKPESCIIQMENGSFILSENQQGYYLDIDKKNYFFCDISCLTCNITSNHCLKCKTGYYALEDKANTCIFADSSNIYFDSENKKGYFLNLQISNFFNLCDFSCLTCATSKDYCLECNENYYPLYNNKNSCLSLVPKGLFLDKTKKIIEECDISCLTCEENAKRCLICNIAKNYKKLQKKVTVCKDSAPEGYYLDIIENYYKLCDKSCNTCIKNPDKCIKCNENYFFLEDKMDTCLDKPPIDYYFDYTDKKFNKCDISCDQCKENKYNCLKCREDKDYFMLDFKATNFTKILYEDSRIDFKNEIPFYSLEIICLKIKLDGYFINFEKKIYEKCAKECRTCESKSMCIDCNSLEGFYPCEDDLRSNIFKERLFNIIYFKSLNTIN